MAGQAWPSYSGPSAYGWAILLPIRSLGCSSPRQFLELSFKAESRSLHASLTVQSRISSQATEGVRTMRKGSAKPVRCAIYTRVSTDQGLEQDFNSARRPI